VAAGLLPLGTLGFVAWKTRAVARELVDPPFYRPQSLDRVAQTYAELARGGDGDPGGAWSSEAVGGLELWTLRRREPARGIVLLLHGFGDDRWGTSPALKWFPDLDAAIFTYRGRDAALRRGGPAPAVTFGAREHEEAVAMVRHLEARGWKRSRILLMGRSLGASVGLLAVSALEADGGGPLGGVIWEGAPASSRDFAERLVRGPKDRAWHVLAPAIGALAARRAGRAGAYDPAETDLLARVHGPLQTPSLCFMATQDRLAPLPAQRALAARFAAIRTVEADTWHLHCAEILGPRYAAEIRGASTAWLK
jgi:dienelactone hydrolase